MQVTRPILLTGAAGFIGSHVAEALLAHGQRVVGVDSFDPFYERSRKEANLAGVRAAAASAAGSSAAGGGERGLFDFVEADVCDEEAVWALFAAHRPSSVIHLAAKAGVRPSIADPAGYARANVLGTSVLLEAARRSGSVDRFIMASSSSVYGNSPSAPFSEEQNLSEPISPYAATKRACELIAQTHHHLTGMPTASLRFFTVYGPRQRPDLAIATFMRLIASGQEVRMFGDGSMSRDFTFIGDIVRGVLAAHDRVDAHGYRVWNLGSDRPVKLLDMIQAIGRVVGREPAIRQEPPQPGDVERTWADLARVKRELAYRAETPFEEGLARQWAWMQENDGVSAPAASPAVVVRRRAPGATKGTSAD